MQKKYTNKGSRENNRQGASYALFQVTGVSMKKSRDAPCLLFSLLPLFCITIPTYFCNLLIIFILVSVTFFFLLGLYQFKNTVTRWKNATPRLLVYMHV